MKTLKQWWAFANDATTLSNAEIVALGIQQWSGLAEQALVNAAVMIHDHSAGDEACGEGSDPEYIIFALERHPQAFEELSLAIGEALERMREVVPEAKREEPKPIKVTFEPGDSLRVNGETVWTAPSRVTTHVTSVKASFDGGVTWTDCPGPITVDDGIKPLTGCPWHHDVHVPHCSGCNQGTK